VDLPLRCPEPQARTDADGDFRLQVVTTGLGQDLGQASVCFILSAIFRTRYTTSAPTDKVLMDTWGRTSTWQRLWDWSAIGAF